MRFLDCAGCALLCAQTRQVQAYVPCPSQREIQITQFKAQGRELLFRKTPAWPSPAPGFELKSACLTKDAVYSVSPAPRPHCHRSRALCGLLLRPREGGELRRRGCAGHRLRPFRAPRAHQRPWAGRHPSRAAVATTEPALAAAALAAAALAAAALAAAEPAGVPRPRVPPRASHGRRNAPHARVAAGRGDEPVPWPKRRRRAAPVLVTQGMSNF